MAFGGYKNRVLLANLNDRTFSEETLPDDLIENYLGGRGFGIKWLWDRMSAGADPLGPDNPLIFIAGPLAGTNAQSFARWKVFFKSPLTGGAFRSCGGGHWASELKFAGFDAIIVNGVSEKPVYIWIHDGQYEYRDAGYLWGLDCDDTHTLVREELRDPSVRLACIGPAGERGVRYAGIFSDRRTAARGGGGAVMGAKNLKAIAVRGRDKVLLADPEGFAAAVKEQVAAYQANKKFKHFSWRGTQDAENMNILGVFGTRNFREGQLPDWHKIEGSVFDKMRVRKTACYSCMIHCGSLTRVYEGRYAGYWSEGPEYEGIWAFTGPMGCNDPGLTVAADHVCDLLGLDNLSVGGCIGFAYELYDKGIITKADTGGLELTWGNDIPVLSLIKMIAFREGFGDFLAEGVREMSRRLGQGTDHFAMHVKGLEFPGYDPRGAKAHGLNFSTTSIGADHNSGYGSQELFGSPWKVDRFTTDNKGVLTKWNQDIMSVRDSCIMCGFAGLFLEDFDVLSKLLTSCTGVQQFSDHQHLWQLGERVTNLERMFNVREGLGREDDSMPGRIVRDPMPSGPCEGQVFEHAALLEDYYAIRGWESETGFPSDRKLDELGLGFTKTAKLR